MLNMRRNSCSVPCSWELVALKQTYSDADEFPALADPSAACVNHGFCSPILFSGLSWYQETGLIKCVWRL